MSRLFYGRIEYWQIRILMKTNLGVNWQPRPAAYQHHRIHDETTFSPSGLTLIRPKNTERPKLPVCGLLERAWSSGQTYQGLSLKHSHASHINDCTSSRNTNTKEFEHITAFEES